MAKRKKKKRIGKTIFIIFVILLIAAVVYFKFIRKTEDGRTSYQTSELLTVDIESIVSSTGTLSAVGTVEVGTQVSGLIDSILVDFNDRVKQEEVLAILDRTTLELTYEETRANLRKAEASYSLKKEQYENDTNLHSKEFISDFELKQSETELVTAETSLTSAQIALQKADRNLNEYAIIRSPMDGIVISREIEEGQTVQASMSAPTLFILAEDLGNMEIEALVDESDIGMIKDGQEIRFTVEAYMDEEFSGNVEQVRMLPTTVSDVVHYTVVCSAENKKGLLLPGMTATIEFVIDNRENVTAVPNSALSLTMPVSVLEEMKKKMEKSRSEQQKESARNQKSEYLGERKAKDTDLGRIWYIASDGNIGMSLVKKGLSDGINTEVTILRELPEAAKIITKVKTTEETANISQRQSGMMRPGPGLF